MHVVTYPDIFVQLLLSIIFNLVEEMLRSHILIANLYYLAIFWDVIGYLGRARLSKSCITYGFAQSLTASDGGVLSVPIQFILDTLFSPVG